MTDPERRDRHSRHDSRERDDLAREPSPPAEDAPAVRQDDALTGAERLPRRGDHEMPPGNDSSV